MTITDLLVLDFHEVNQPYRNVYMLMGYDALYYLHVEVNDEYEVHKFALIGAVTTDWTILPGDESDLLVMIDRLSELEYPPANTLKRKQLITDFLDEN